MITLGIILLIVGLVFGIPLASSLGLLLLIIGVVLALLGMADRGVGGRRHYW